ncbi:MAG: hypothetical protein MI919_36005 [Holophagales bacterium]|nr:hypothetical protein [Holophagales bacterium]
MRVGRNRLRMIDTATPEDIGRLYGLEWTPALLLRLANRVDEAAHESPREGYELAMRALVHLGQRYGDEDVEARGWMCAGIAARRLGRAGEASDLYARAKRLAKHPSTLGRLYVSIAILARDAGRHAEAFSAAEQAERLGRGPNHSALVAVVRGSIYAVRAHNRDSPTCQPPAADFAEATQLFLSALEKAVPGSPEQASAMLYLAAAIGADGRGMEGSTSRARRVLGQVRASVAGSRSRPMLRIRAIVDWIEGRIHFRLGSSRQGVRLLLRAARTLARLDFLREALEASADLAELACEHDVEFERAADVVALVPKDSQYRPAAEVLAELASGEGRSSGGAAGVREALSSAG